MKKILSIIVLMLAMCQQGKAQAVALRTNAAGWALLAPNVGVDLVLTEKATLSASVYKTIGETYIKDAEVTALQLSYRHWYSHQPFNGMFWGLSLSPAIYDVTIDGKNQEGETYGVKHEGEAVPFTIDFGYSIPLSRRMNLELMAGVGAVYFVEHIHYDTGKRRRHDWSVAPANVGVSLSWLLL